MGVFRSLYNSLKMFNFNLRSGSMFIRVLGENVLHVVQVLELLSEHLVDGLSVLLSDLSGLDDVLDMLSGHVSSKLKP